MTDSRQPCVGHGYNPEVALLRMIEGTRSGIHIHTGEQFEATQQLIKQGLVHTRRGQDGKLYALADGEDFAEPR